MVRRALASPLALAVVLGLAGGAVVAGAYLGGDITQRCLRTEPPRGTDQSQARVSASADYLRGRLTCRWSNEGRSLVSSRDLPLYSHT